MSDPNNLTHEDYERFRRAKRECPAIAAKMEEIAERDADRLQIRVLVGRRRRIALSRAEAATMIGSLAEAIATPKKWGTLDIEIAGDRA